LPSPTDIEVLNDENAHAYWERSDLFDMALDLTAGRHGLAALGEVIALWISHLLAVKAEVEPLTEAENVNLAWYVGLDAQATEIGDALWDGEELDEAARKRIVGLFRLTLRDPDVALDRAKGEPIYLLSAMTGDQTMRIKPQNLVTGLPVRHLETAS
jgi:hypothetical protein